MSEFNPATDAAVKRSLRQAGLDGVLVSAVAKGSRDGVFAGVNASAREGDLPGVRAQMLAPYR